MNCRQICEQQRPAYKLPRQIPSRHKIVFRIGSLIPPNVPPGEKVYKPCESKEREHDKKHLNCFVPGEYLNPALTNRMCTVLATFVWKLCGKLKERAEWINTFIQTTELKQKRAPTTVVVQQILSTYTLHSTVVYCFSTFFIIRRL